MILDPNSATRRGFRVLGAVSLALLAVIVIGAKAGAPPSRAASTPLVASMPAAIPIETRVGVTPEGRMCDEGLSGSFNGFFSEGPGGTELNETHNGDFALQQRLGDGQRLCGRVHGAVRYDERDGSILELPRGA